MQRAIAFTLLSLIALRALSAQPPGATLTGTVRTAAGTPISDVAIFTRDLRIVAQSDTAGRFTIRNLEPGKAVFTVRRIGFEPRELYATLVGGAVLTVDVTLEELAVMLPGIPTTADSRVRRILAAYHRRRDSGAGGRFLMRADIEKRGAVRLSDLMRTMAGFDVRSAGIGRTTTRVARSLANGRECPPDVWVDGIQVPGLNVDDISPGDVEALEVYAGAATIPSEFRSRRANQACGVIGIWTRVPGT
jgi:hypothetical protein